MSYGRLDELLENRNVKDVSFDELRHLLEHYGFIMEGGGAHIHFRHREYTDIKRFNIPYDTGSMKAIYVKVARDACLEVKRRNAERKQREGLSGIPDWVKTSLPSGFQVSGDTTVLNLKITPRDESARHYTLTLRGNSLHVDNHEYPNEHISFTLRDGDHRLKQSFASAFASLDRNVQQRNQNAHTTYDDRIKRLRENRGFECRYDNARSTRNPQVHFTHPAYHMSAQIPLRLPADFVEQATLDRLENLMQNHENKYYQQLEFIEQLNRSGWNMRRQGGNRMQFSHPQRGSFELSIYGALETFDFEAARKQVNARAAAAGGGAPSDRIETNSVVRTKTLTSLAVPAR